MIYDRIQTDIKEAMLSKNCIRRAAEGGLAPGDWFTLARHVAVNGENRAECVYPLWDGKKWIDYETERPVRA